MPDWFPVAMPISAFAAVVASIWLARWNAGTEPFFGPFNLQHAAISLIGGGVGILFWIAWGVAIGLAVRKRWLPSISLAFLLLVLFGLLVNGITVYSYLIDRQTWMNWVEERGPF